LDEGIEFHKVRYRTTEHYLAYFQSFSNTYAPLERLRELYEEALSHPDVVGLVIGTRPDCVDEEKLDYLADLAAGRVLTDWSRSLAGEPERKAPVIIVEYGIESCYDSTLKRINRGHDFETARRAVEMTAARGIDVGAHFILGLPGETRQMMLDSIEKINSLPIRSVKFHQLQIVKGTRMEKEFAEQPEDFERFSLDEYLDFFVDVLERMRPDISIERFVGEVPPRFVNETPWGLIRNVEILRLLDKKLEERNTWQGRLACSNR
jgi:radical SAM protein (TIGR01212 family)